MLTGRIVNFDGAKLTIHADFDNAFELQKKQIRTCEIRLDDGRHISAQQRKKIYATLGDISLYTGHTSEYLKDFMKVQFIALTGCEWFSLSNVDMTTANLFLEFLLEFCLKWDIPCYDDSFLNRSPDVARYIYACLIHKKCCITGKKAELHHVDAVGMGRNRKDIIHLGMRVLPLTRIMHTEAHRIGNLEFCEKYHVFGIQLDKDLCKVWRVKYE